MYSASLKFEKRAKFREIVFHNNYLQKNLCIVQFDETMHCWPQRLKSTLLKKKILMTLLGTGRVMNF